MYIPATKTLKRKLRETIPFRTASKIIKYQRINLTRKVKDLYIEHRRTALKHINKDLNKWKDILYSRVEKLNIVKTATLTKAIYKFSPIPTKSLTTFFAEMEKLILKFMWKYEVLGS